MTTTRQPPPGYTVENTNSAAEWVTKNPAGQVIGMGWKTEARAVQIAWDAHDAIARAERATQPGWFACAGDNQLGGPYDTRSEAEQRLTRYVDNGTFHVAYGQRNADWTFTELPEPATT